MSCVSWVLWHCAAKWAAGSTTAQCHWKVCFCFFYGQCSGGIDESICMTLHRLDSVLMAVLPVALCWGSGILKVLQIDRGTRTQATKRTRQPWKAQIMSATLNAVTRLSCSCTIKSDPVRAEMTQRSCSAYQWEIFAKILRVRGFVVSIFPCRWNDKIWLFWFFLKYLWQSSKNSVAGQWPRLFKRTSFFAFWNRN